MERHYIIRSSMWDVGPEWYPKEKIAKALKEAGATNVRFAKMNGWSNQPQVVTFTFERTIKLDNLLLNVQRRCKKNWKPIAAVKGW